MTSVHLHLLVVWSSCVWSCCLTEMGIGIALSTLGWWWWRDERSGSRSIKGHILLFSQPFLFNYIVVCNSQYFCSFQCPKSKYMQKNRYLTEENHTERGTGLICSLSQKHSERKQVQKIDKRTSEGSKKVTTLKHSCRWFDSLFAGCPKMSS